MRPDVEHCRKPILFPGASALRLGHFELYGSAIDIGRYLGIRPASQGKARLSRLLLFVGAGTPENPCKTVVALMAGVFK
jgi:hypothetical protein